MSCTFSVNEQDKNNPKHNTNIKTNRLAVSFLDQLSYVISSKSEKKRNWKKDFGKTLIMLHKSLTENRKIKLLNLLNILVTEQQFHKKQTNKHHHICIYSSGSPVMFFFFKALSTFVISLFICSFIMGVNGS